MSFYDTGNPVPSIDPRDLDDNAKHIDEAVNSTFPTFVDRLGTTRKTLAGIEADADAATLRGDLAAPSGASLSGFTLGASGSAIETVQDVLRSLTVSTVRFGAVCDGVADDTLPVLAALAYVEFMGGGTVYNPGVSVISASALASAGLSSVPVRYGVRLLSVGKGYEKTPVGGFLFKGTGAKVYSIADATAVTFANPDAGAAYLADSGTRGDTYSTLDLTVPFSAGIIVSKGGKLEEMGVYPWFDGVTGYAGTDGRLSDDWGVGVWCQNASGWRTTEIIVDGHWRKAGLLVSSSDIGDGNIPQCELGQAFNCSFGGFRGIAIRAPRSATGSTNYGFAGTDFINCFIRSLNHQSLHLATSSFLTAPFNSPSACIEFDGSTVLRGVQFINCTRMGRDDVSVISDYCSEIKWNGSYAESKSIKVSGSFLSDSLGARMIGTANTVAFFETQNTKYAIDYSPYYAKDSSLTVSRYNPALPGLWNPSTAFDEEWVYPNFAASLGIRLRTGQTFRLYDNSFTNQFSVTEVGTVSSAGNYIFDQESAGIYAVSSANPIIRRFPSGTVQIGSGAANLSDGTLTNPGIIRHTTNNVSSFGTPSFMAASTYSRQLFVGGGTQLMTGGSGTPEGVVTAPVGSQFLRSNGGAATTLYIKETGAGNTGWVAK